MKSRYNSNIRLALLAGSLAITVTTAVASENWPQFRGPNCSGASAQAKPPLKIGPTNNVVWTVDVPSAPSSPCVWGNRIFLTSFEDGKLATRCYSARDGKAIWVKELKPEHLELFHRTEGSPAAATPACDGKHVVSYFGSFGLICYDLNGKELWRHTLPLALSGGSFGSGTSPAIIQNRVLLNRDQDQNSSLLAVDVATGKTAWEAPRPDAYGSFGTPILWKDKGVDEVVMPGSLKLKGYDLKTGKERWVVEGVVGFACTTPVVGDGYLFFAGWSPGKTDSPWPTWEVFAGKYDKNSDGVITLDEFDADFRDFGRGMDRNHDGKVTKEEWESIRASAAKADNVLVAVKPGGKGNITESHVAWKAIRGLPYVPSPLFLDGKIYLVRDGGMLSCYDSQTGTAVYSQERLEATGSYYASPVAAMGRIYVASLPGKLTVVKAGGDKPEILHQADFGERIFATPALAGSNIYLRTQTKLYAFGPGKD